VECGCDSLREGVVPKGYSLELADGFKLPAGDSMVCAKASVQCLPGILSPIELEWRMCGNHGGLGDALMKSGIFDKCK
jgi:hypothetical protein